MNMDDKSGFGGRPVKSHVVKKSNVAKMLFLRQTYGCMKRFQRQTPFRIFHECPDRLQIPLKDIFSTEILVQGHVAVGFTRDGNHLLSYRCKLDPRINGDCVVIHCTYTLYWWLFNLHEPLTKVYELALFSGQEIHQELLLSFCQPSHGRHIIVLGSTLTHHEGQNAGPTTFVTIAPCPSEFGLRRRLSSSDVCIHLQYELLPPHPPVVPSVCFAMEDVFFLNSGDMLFAVLLAGSKNQLWTGRTKAKVLPMALLEECAQEKPNNSTVCEEGVVCYCSLATRTATSNADSLTCTQTRSRQDMSSEQCAAHTCEHFRSDCLVSSRCSDGSDPSIRGQPCHPSEAGTPECSCGCREPKSDQGLKTEYLSYVVQGYSLRRRNEAFGESLPQSPFDCTSTVLPFTATNNLGNEVLSHSYEHRCFRGSDKGSPDCCDFFICEAHFDPESFLNEEIQRVDDIGRRFVSMRDLDMQVVEVCPSSGEVVLIVNALIILRDQAKRSKRVPPSTMSSLASDLKEDYCKLSAYTIGYVVSWRVATGKITILSRHPLIEQSGSVCKSPKFCPSLTQSMKLQKQWWLPSCKSGGVQILSNRTVFSGRSLQYLLHPTLPVAVVMS